MRACFITATGTGVGKTLAAGLLARRMRARAIKPVESGFDSARPEASDAGKLLAAMGEPITPENLKRIAPWRFAAPLAPPLAAAREGRELRLEDIAAFCREEMDKAAREGAFLLIEGAGGVMSPLDARHTCLDLIAALGIPALLVAGTYLGAISHTLTALEALRARGAQLAGVLCSASCADGAADGEAAALLRSFLPEAPPFAFLPRLALDESALSTHHQGDAYWRAVAAQAPDFTGLVSYG